MCYLRDLRIRVFKVLIHSTRVPFPTIRINVLPSLSNVKQHRRFLLRLLDNRKQRHYFLSKRRESINCNSEESELCYFQLFITKINTLPDMTQYFRGIRRECGHRTGFFVIFQWLLRLMEVYRHYKTTRRQCHNNIKLKNPITSLRN